MTIDSRLFLHLGNYLWLLIIIGLLAVPPSHAKAATSEDGPKLGAIAAHLASKDKSIRAEAAVDLKGYGQSAMPFLIGIREYGSPAQRRGAIIGMALLPIPALATDQLIDALGDDDPTSRSFAAHSLALIGSMAAPQQLAAQLSCEDRYTRDAAAYALELMGRKSIPALIETLASDDAFAKSKAAWLLGRMGNKAQSAIPSLIRALDSDDDRVMHVIAEAIDLIGPDPGIAYYHLMLLHSEPGGFPLPRIGREASPVLVRLLMRPGTPLGQLAFRALANIGEIASPALMDALHSGTPSQRTAAALLLVEIDPDVAHTLPDELRRSLAGAKRQPKQ